MERRKTSKVDRALNKLEVGEAIPVEGSISYWRNRQAIFHKENPTKWIEISKRNETQIAERIN